MSEPDSQGREHLIYIVTFSGNGPPPGDYDWYDEPHTFGVELGHPVPFYSYLWLKRRKLNYWGAVDAHTGQFYGWGFEGNPLRPGEFW